MGVRGGFGIERGGGSALDDASTSHYITPRRELNEAEQGGILAANAWAFARKRDVLDEKFLRVLHKRMFGSVWRWAGAFRTTARNIGTYEPDEIAARFHHRLSGVVTGGQQVPPYSVLEARPIAVAQQALRPSKLFFRRNILYSIR